MEQMSLNLRLHPVRRWFEKEPSFRHYFLSLLLLGLMWAIVQPPLGVGDESRHLIRAASAIRLDFGSNETEGFLGFPHREYKVPSAFEIDEAFMPCHHLQERVLPGCEDVIGEGRDVVTARSPAFETPPAGYFLLGLPLIAFPGSEGFYLARILGAIWCALALAVAFYVLSVRGRRWTISALFLSLTPMAFSLFGSLNPHGFEIAFSTAYLVLIAEIFSAEDDEPSPLNRLLVRLMIPLSLFLGAVGTLSRLGTFVWLSPAVLLIFARFVFFNRRLPLRQLVSARHILVLLPPAFSFVWYLSQVGGLRTGIAGGYIPAPGTFLGNLQVMLNYSDLFLTQSVGWFGWGEIYVPGPIFLLFVALLAQVFVLILQTCRASRALTFAFLLGYVLSVPVLSESLGRSTTIGYQGRYGLIAVQSMIVLGTWQIKDSAVNKGKRILGLFLLLTLIVQIGTFWRVAKRFTVGQDGPVWWLGREDWPVGDLAMLLRTLTVVGVLALTALFVRLTLSYTSSRAT